MPKKNIHPNIKAKKPPQNSEAEQALLGSILLSQNAAINTLPYLNETDFYISAHKQIFEAMQQVFSDNKPVDIVTTTQQLNVNGKLDSSGGVEYLTSLTSLIPTAANYNYYYSIVKENGLRRKLIESLEEIIQEAYAGEKEDILEYAESTIFKLGEQTERKEFVPISNAVSLAYQRMEEIARDKAAFKGIPSGFKLLDGYLNGFQRGDLIVLAARPGHGKTSLGMNFITNAALSSIEKIPGIKSKIYCAVFSLEMPAEQLARRMLCSVSKVSMTRASKGDLLEEEWAKININRIRLDEAEIFIDDTSAITPAEIISKCRRLKREKHLDIVLIDYLQLINSGKKVENRQQEISEITRNLKIAAKELDVPIILISQLSRKVEERSNKMPQMSDLRESGAIEQDADIILFIYKPSESEALKENLPLDIHKLIIAKHRNGETGEINLKWRGEYVSFEDYFEEKPGAKAINTSAQFNESLEFAKLDGVPFRVSDTDDDVVDF